jgi:glyoxylase I family protein
MLLRSRVNEWRGGHAKVLRRLAHLVVRQRRGEDGEVVEGRVRAAGAGPARPRRRGLAHAILLELTETIAIEFQQHDTNGGEAFNPVRTGFDHMGLAVDSRNDLLEWQTHFESLGVVHTPVVDREYGSVLTFKDPDRIQFELFYLDPEFQAAATPR